MRRHDVDVLVVGAGLAGLATALSAQGRRVTLLCPWRPPAAAASAVAQGGIAAAVSDSDSAELHAADTLRAGAGECDPRAVDALCGEAASGIEWLQARGVQFDRNGEGWALHREAAHSRARVLHIDSDRTGSALIKQLALVARSQSDIEFLTGQTAVALTREADHVTGVVALDAESHALWVTARETVLATGGVGQLYSHTTNPRSACGDGLAMALAAGARCAGLELVQFHPTALDVAADPLPLMTEALRGAGAQLVDARGVRFMSDIHPAAELAPRDVVAREVWKNTRAGGRVYLDATDVFVRQPTSFPAVRALCAAHDIDPARSPIPVVPAAHYHMGGVAVDLEGRSSLPHLWACGEVACTGVHGANRLASNSLLEAVVFGRRLGQALAMAREASPRPKSAVPGEFGEGWTLQVDAQIWSALRQAMGAHLGIVRTAMDMQAGLATLQQLEPEVPGGQILLRNRLRLARSMWAAALMRKVSCGAHFRGDHPPVNTRADPDQGARRFAGR